MTGEVKALRRAEIVKDCSPAQSEAVMALFDAIDAMGTPHFEEKLTLANRLIAACSEASQVDD
jgi:hypothetical protein